MKDPYRDIMRMKAKERFGVGMLNSGLGAIVAKNIIVAENFEPVYSVRTMTG